MLPKTCKHPGEAGEYKKSAPKKKASRGKEGKLVGKPFLYLVRYL